jgi:hypothetical protein
MKDDLKQKMIGVIGTHSNALIESIAEKCAQVAIDFYQERDQALSMSGVSGSLTPFLESIKLLRDLVDLQNGAPLERHRKEWEETMEQVYEFLNRWECQ